MTAPGGAEGPDRGPAPPPPPEEDGPPAHTPASGALARATRALRDEPDPGWPELAEQVSRRLRTVSRPGRPLTLQASATGTLRVDQRVVVDTVRRAAAQVPGCRPVGVDVETDAQQVARVRLEVWASYGSDVVAVAEAARVAVSDSLLEVLARVCPVDVAVVDVEVR